MAGLPFDLINIKSATRVELNKLIDDYQNSNSEQEEKKKELDNSLYELINKEKDVKIRKEILNIKRDIFNDRFIIGRHSLEVVNEELNNSLYLFSFKQNKYEKDIEKGKICYNRILDEERLNLKYIFEQFELKNALLLSSSDLLNNINKYDPYIKIKNKKFHQLEASMYKYATRICSKTSPFSTFTSVGLANFSDVPNHNLIVAGTSQRSISLIRFNSLIFRQIIICLKANKFYRQFFFITLNSSITLKGDHYLFLINRYNKETFQRLSYNRILKVIHKKLSIKKKLTFNDIKKYIKNKVEEDEGEIENYLLELINYGFLEIQIGISEIDSSWDTKLMDFLKKCDIKDNLLGSKLLSLIKWKEKYINTENYTERRSILLDLHKSYKEILYITLIDSDYFIKSNNNIYYFYRRPLDQNNILDFTFKEIALENIIFEDVRKDIGLDISFKKVEEIAQKFNRLTNETKLFKIYNLESFNAFNYYKTTYKETNIDLLTFYEDYFRNKYEKQFIINSDLGNNIPNKKNVEIPQQIKVINNNKIKWKKSFESGAKQIDNNFQFHFNEIYLNEINKKSDTLCFNSKSKNSFSSFVQFYYSGDHKNGKQLMAVFSPATYGYGKLYSRFLNLFPKEVLQEMKNWNNKLLSETEIFVENSDSTVFNANLHPPIMDYEINIPGGNNLFMKNHQIRVSDITIKINDKTQKLELSHKLSGKSITIFDLCLQGNKGRSNLFQLLEIFSRAEHLGNFYLAIFNETFGVDLEVKNYFGKKIKHYPRIIFDECIVVQRKYWIIPRECIPSVQKDSNFNSFFVFNGWRKELGLPNEVFVRINRRPDYSKIPAEKKRKQDDYKPQYINFMSPLSVIYFEKLIRKVNNEFTIEEMLPNSEQLFTINNRKTVTEFLIQWNNQ
ncbi:MAG: lantibiotic dehydratase [Minisyncoccia bacterium]